jgi:hypothetical protein
LHAAFALAIPLLVCGTPAMAAPPAALCERLDFLFDQISAYFSTIKGDYFPETGDHETRMLPGASKCRVVDGPGDVSYHCVWDFGQDAGTAVQFLSDTVISIEKCIADNAFAVGRLQRTETSQDSRDGEHATIGYAVMVTRLSQPAHLTVKLAPATPTDGGAPTYAVTLVIERKEDGGRKD